MKKGNVTISGEEINALIEELWQIQERFPAARQSLEALESRIAASVPDEG